MEMKKQILTAELDKRSGNLVASFEDASDVINTACVFGGKKVKLYDAIGSAGEKAVDITLEEAGITDLSEISHFIVDVMTPEATVGYSSSVVIPFAELEGGYAGVVLYALAEWVIDGGHVVVQTPATCIATVFEQDGTLEFETGVFDLAHAPGEPVDQTHNIVIARIYAVYE